MTDYVLKAYALFNEIEKELGSVDATYHQVQAYLAMWKCKKVGVFKKKK